MGKVEGRIQITGLPAHRGLMVSLCLFPVADANAPKPHDGDPPPEAVTDCERVVEQVDLEREFGSDKFEAEYALERESGFYFVQLRVILFRLHEGEVLAQAENFFFGRRPLHITAEPSGDVTLPVEWPQQSVSELHHYGTFSPNRRRPWWRFW